MRINEALVKNPSSIYDQTNLKAKSREDLLCYKASSLEIKKVASLIEDFGYNAPRSFLKEEKISVFLEQLESDSSFLKELLETQEDFEHEDIMFLEKRRRGDEREVTYTDPKYNIIKQMPDGLLISNIDKKEVSLNTLYQGCYAGEPRKTSENYPKEMLESLLVKNQLPTNEGNLWAVSKLMTYGMEITPSSISKIQNIKSAVDTLEYQERIKDDFEKNTGINPDKPLIKNGAVTYNQKEISAIKNLLGKVSDEDAQEIIKMNDISVDSIKKVMHSNTLKVSEMQTLEGKLVIPEDNLEEEVKNAKDVSCTSVEELKENIRIIRLKLTVEAAQRLSKKMSVEYSPLTDVAKELLAQETIHVEAALEKASVPKTTETIKVVRETLSALQLIGENKWVVPIKEYDKGFLHLQDVSLRKMEDFINSYTENQTQAKKAFGEGFNKVSSQIGHLLETMGVEITGDNERAAKALIVNKVEVTPQALEQAKIALNKIDVFLEDMTPYKAVELLRSGINPYTEGIDSIMEWSGSFQYPKLKEGVAEMLVAVNEKGFTTQKQKNALVSLYKIIDVVSQNKEAVVGYMIKKEGFLSIERFNEAIKTMQKSIEVSIGDQADERLTMLNPAKQAKTLTRSALEESLGIREMMTSIENAEIEVETLTDKELSLLRNNLYALLKKHIKNELDYLKKREIVPESLIKKIEYIKDVDYKIVNKMIERQIPITISNLYWMKKTLKNEKSWTASVSSEEGFPKNTEALNERVKKMIEESDAKAGEFLKKGDSHSYQEQKECSDRFHFQKQVLNKEGFFQIPFLINGKQRLINLLIDQKKSCKEETAQITALLSCELEHLGDIKAKIVFDGEKINYTITTKSQQAREEIKKQSKNLHQAMATLGKVITGESFSVKQSNPKEVYFLGESLIEGVL